MNTLQAKAKLKQQRFAKLTNADRKLAEGQDDELRARIEKPANQTKEAVEETLNGCFADEL